jgi:LacI family transcriptional regulator
MSRFLNAVPRVLIALSTVQKARRDKLQGILKYARLNGPWDVQMVEDHPYIPRLGSFRNWQPDGLIRDGSEPLPLLGIRRARRIHTVLLDTALPPRRTAFCVNHDSRQTGECAADDFMRQGLRHFAYVGSLPQALWSDVRAEAFADRLRQSGHACAVYAPEHADDWGLEQKHMRKCLASLPKPCGVLVALDLRAKQVLDTCRAARIRVPEELSVIGVDNDETVCENTTPKLSSVLPDFEGGGYRAAELLDRLMRRAVRKPVQLSYGVLRIVHRQSSRDVPLLSRMAAEAIRFIQLNACAGIAVSDVSAHLRVSRRLAELRFRESRGHSILEEIQRCRLERVCALLRETDLPIGAVGERCGYPTENHLKALFKARFGATMRAYRKGCEVGRTA